MEMSKLGVVGVGLKHEAEPPKFETRLEQPCGSGTSGEPTKAFRSAGGFMEWETTPYVAGFGTATQRMNQPCVRLGQSHIPGQDGCEPFGYPDMRRIMSDMGWMRRCNIYWQVSC
jgi:hypothetical protein